MSQTISGRPGATSPVQRVSLACPCGQPIAKPARGPRPTWCSRCRPEQRQRAQLRAYLAAAKRLAERFGLDDVADYIAPTVALVRREP